MWKLFFRIKIYIKDYFNLKLSQDELKRLGMKIGETVRKP